MTPELKAVLDRDGWRCKVPGCSSRVGLERHHVIHRSQGGDDSPDRMVTLCAEHHRAHHEGLLEVTGRASSGFRFRHRPTPGSAWRRYPEGADAPFHPAERAWDGTSYVSESARPAWASENVFKLDVTWCPTASPGGIAPRSRPREALERST